MSLNYTLESQLSTNEIVYETPNSLRANRNKNNERTLSNGMKWYAIGDNLYLSCPNGYAFLKDAYGIRNRKQETYYTDDGLTYDTLWAEGTRSGLSLVVNSYAGSYYQARARYNNNTGKTRSRVTRATCVPIESDGHWNV